ncbi:hypothetical protein ACH4U3_35095 [Streptomyces griseoruber]|uniref:hypothetical protein n=1 Tax=Streptomyces griseoruber TaxID=1943 RepID=UPI0037BAB36E
MDRSEGRELTRQAAAIQLLRVAERRQAADTEPAHIHSIVRTRHGNDFGNDHPVIRGPLTHE